MHTHMDKISTKRNIVESLQKDAKRNYKLKETTIEEIMDEVCQKFQSELTFETFYQMCDVFRVTGDWQCADPLKDAASKISTTELKRILDFLLSEGIKEEWDNCEVGVGCIIMGHSAGDWLKMDDERFELLKPYLDADILQTFIEDGNVRKLIDIPSGNLRTVFNILLKKE